jgi:transcription initiation factor TFIID TATA-box-binding protein
MTDIRIENIVASSKIASKLSIKQLSTKLKGTSYNPEEFTGLTIKFKDPNVAVLLLPNGKAVSTGAKNLDQVNNSIKKVSNRLKKAGVTIRKKQETEVQNIIVTTNLKKELHLSSIAKGLLLENTNYEPDQFPGLIYKIENSSAIVIIFSSGKLVCTGSKSLEEATKTVGMMKDKLSSLGVL